MQSSVTTFPLCQDSCRLVRNLDQLTLSSLIRESMLPVSSQFLIARFLESMNLCICFVKLLQFLKQHFCILHTNAVAGIGKPVIDWCDQVVSIELFSLALP